MKKSKEKIIEEFCKRYCYICKNEMILNCGTPKVIIGGCCVGIDDGKTRYLRELTAHYECYNNKHKTMIPFNEINKRRKTNSYPKDKCACGNIKTKEAKTCYKCYLKSVKVKNVK